ncbi:MAG: HEPN domain-containing protein, partial [Flavobacterium sp.]
MELQFFSAFDRHTVDFKSFIGLLIDKFKPLQIFCFSKRFIMDGMSGTFVENTTAYQCHYCLLMVTDTNTRIDHEVQDYANGLYVDGTITILCHGQEPISEAIQKNSRFFISLYSIGKLIYSRDGINVLNLTRRYDIADAPIKAYNHYQHRISLAEAFLIGANECLAKEQYAVCTFLLHQVVEQCCIGLIRVFLAYRSEVHNLKRLLLLCNAFSDAPYNLFLSGTKEDSRLFEILVKSYSQARYGNTFQVQKQD